MRFLQFDRLVFLITSCRVRISKTLLLGLENLTFAVDSANIGLLRALEEFLADDFTPEIRHAWMTVYGMIAETMIDAAEDFMP
jgi:hypothetical protein